MQELLSAIGIFLSIHFGLPAGHEHPRVEFVPAVVLSDLRYSTVRADRRADVSAVYDDKTRTIYLADTWSGRTPAEISIVVHEMAHHLQNVGGLEFPCPAAREEIANQAQDLWLRFHKQSLFEEFDMDPITLKVRTSCF